MKRNFLKELGIDDEVIEKIMAENGKDLNDLKTQIANLQDDLHVKDGVIDVKNSKIKELENVDIEAIKSSEYQRGLTDGNKEIAEFKKHNAIEKAMANYKPKDANVLSKMIDFEKLEFNDNYEITKGLEEQINPLKETHSYLFEDESEKTKPTFTTQNTNKPNDEITKEMFKKMTYSQRMELYEKDKETYNKLKE